MTRKRFVKKLMGMGHQRNESKILTRAFKRSALFDDADALWMLSQMPPEFFIQIIPILKRKYGSV